MEKITGRIETKAEAIAKTGKPYWSFTVAGQKFNSFDEAHKDMQVNDFVEVELKQEGQYKNLISMKSITETPGKVAEVGSIAATEGISKVEHVFQNSHEFGPAGNRHKIRYWTIEELKANRQALIEAGLFEDIE